MFGDDAKFLVEVKSGQVEASLNPDRELRRLKQMFEAWKKEQKAAYEAWKKSKDEDNADNETDSKKEGLVSLALFSFVRSVEEGDSPENYGRHEKDDGHEQDGGHESNGSR